MAEPRRSPAPAVHIEPISAADNSLFQIDICAIAPLKPGASCIALDRRSGSADLFIRSLAYQLKEMYIDAEVEIVETALWYPKMYRKDYTHGG